MNEDPNSMAGERVDYETAPLGRNTYVTALIHLYRGEVSRANTWRQRLDQTTNWAVFTTASALGFAFGDRSASHFSLQFANVLLVVLLVLEARRFRLFDVWRSRIRKIETNFFAPILRRELESPEANWGLLVASDLTEPRFHLSMLQAVRLRLVRNYLPVFAVMMVGWVIKVAIHPSTAGTLDTLYRRCEVGSVPAWATLCLIAAFYLTLLLIVWLGHSEREGLDDWGIGERVTEDMS